MRVQLTVKAAGHLHRSSWPVRVVSAVLLGVAFLVMAASEVPLAEDCVVKSRLVVKDTQTGVVGPTGTVWTIEPDCSFTVARQIGPRIAPPHKQGRLTDMQQVQVRELLGHVGAAALPEHHGEAARANPRQITLSYEGKVSTLNLPSAAALEAPRAGADDPASLMVRLAVALKGMLGI